MNSVEALEAALDGVEPMTEDDVSRSMRLISRRAWEATREHRAIVPRLAEAEAAFNHKHDTALAKSYVENPSFRVAQHDAAARLASGDEQATLTVLRLMERSLRKEGEILGRLISALQTAAANLRGVAA